MSLTVGSLFSGIGGLDLGLERAGMKVLWQSEIDPYACKVLAKHWPQVPNHGNIKNINWGDIVRPDIICGGYPCQPFSTAGKRAGTDDPRHLWPWVREAISNLRPDYAILENVRGHVSLGLSTVLGEMASIGYDAEWQIVSAASVGAPHRRDRVIIVAYPNGRRQQKCQSESEQTAGLSCGCEQCTNPIGELANPDNSGHIHRQFQVVTAENWLNALSVIGSSCADVANTDTRKTCRGFGSISTDTGQVRSQRNHTRREESNASRQWWAVEPDVGRVANGVPNRVDRLRGLGNAVVPQVAELVGRMVIEHHNQ